MSSTRPYREGTRMRVDVKFLFGFFFFNAAISSLMAQPSAPVDIVQVAQTAVDRMEKGDYVAVVAMFNSRLQEKFPESDLRKTWANVHRRSGRLTETGTPITKTKDNLRRV